MAGELTNIRYLEDPAGHRYVRDRYTPPDEDGRATDTMPLVAEAETYGAGDEYGQLAHHLHDNRQLPGTVVILRCIPREVGHLTVCRPEGARWLWVRSRPATAHEVKEITAAAQDWFRVDTARRYRPCMNLPGHRGRRIRRPRR